MFLLLCMFNFLIVIYVPFSVLRVLFFVNVCCTAATGCQPNCGYIYTGCPKRKGPNFGREFLRSNYTDITQNTYIQSSMVTEILAREKCGLDWCLRTVLCP